jgi:hypothetical protein
LDKSNSKNLSIIFNSRCNLVNNEFISNGAMVGTYYSAALIGNYNMTIITIGAFVNIAPGVGNSFSFILYGKIIRLLLYL